MISPNENNWMLNTGKQGLLLFAQSLEELMASHSHDSYKVPALNFHFICFEMENVINLIEFDVLDKGNLIPLFNEMTSLYEQDPIAQGIFGSNIQTVFYKKRNDFSFIKKPINLDSDKINDDILTQIKNGIHFMISEMNRNNQYYVKLIELIKTRIEKCNDTSDFETIYSLTRIVASELINRGFNQAYIYDCIKLIFFNPQCVINSIEIIDDFFECFDTSKKKYCVFLPINSFKQKNALEGYSTFSFAENIYEMFDSSIPYILKYSCENIDPYSAREEAIDIANFCLSVNQFIKHGKYSYDPKYAEVIEVETKKSTFIKKTERAIFRDYTNHVTINGPSELLNSSFGLSGILQVLQLHSAALTSKNTSNQLINLWTATEVAIPVVRKGGLSRINQICNILSATLCHDYFLILIRQLLSDIRSCSEEALSTIQGLELNAQDDVKLLSIIIIPKYKTILDNIINTLENECPLLVCRLQHYNKCWTSTKAIYDTYKTHSKRLIQQIMRIYRTRNMLVHDGSALPYEEYVLQNLHYYIDSYITCLNSYYKNGYRDMRSIVSAVQFKEHQYLEFLLNNQINEDNILYCFGIDEI